MSCNSSDIVAGPLRRVVGLTDVPGFGELLVLPAVDLSLLVAVGGI